MVWSILAAIPLLALLALWLFRFRYHLEYESPDALRIVAGVHFLGWKKILTAEPLRAFGGDAPHGEDEVRASGPASHPAGHDPSRPDEPDAWAGQRGALRLPDAWAAWIGRSRGRFRRAGLKWLLDPGVWRLLAAFAWRSGRRVLRLARPRLDSLHIGLENAYDLARLASAWSVAQATLPALACPVSYGFGAGKAEIRARLGGRFTALDVIFLALLSMTTFPFGGLLRRFTHCWREPELAGWQKRVLLP
jgi:hypothetical protein